MAVGGATGRDGGRWGRVIRFEANFPPRIEEEDGCPDTEAEEEVADGSMGKDVEDERRGNGLGS